MNKALVIINMQKDYCEGGALGLVGGTELATKITDHINAHRHDYDAIVGVRDIHIHAGSHINSLETQLNHNHMIGTMFWPPHCVSIDGCSYPDELSLPNDCVDFIKGGSNADDDVFSHGLLSDPWNDSVISLHEYLWEICSIREVDLVGYSQEHAIAVSSSSALNYNYVTNIISDLTKPLSLAVSEDYLQDLFSDTSINII